MKILCVPFILLMLVSATFGQSNLGSFGVGGKIGIVDPEGNANLTFAFGGIVDFGTIITNLGIEADFTHWSRTQSLGEYTSKISSSCLAFIVKYYFLPESKKLRPYVGAGFGLSRERKSVAWILPVATETSETSFDLSTHVVGGLKQSLSSKIIGFAELRYSEATNFDYWGLFVGVIFKLKE